MDYRKWQKENKQATCTQPPWAIYIPPKDRPEILRKIRQECITAYKYSLDECPKRKICITKKCLGRPLPWKSKTAQPYLKKLAKANNLKKNEELFIKTDCRDCPIYKNCSKICNQVIDFIDRNKSLEPEIRYEKHLENILITDVPIESSQLLVDSNSIPWDILSKEKRKIIEKYLYDQRDFRHIATTEGLYNQSLAKYKFYTALNKISEYAIFRKFLTENNHLLTIRQKQILKMVYFENKKKTQVAKELGISKQSVQQTIAHVAKKYNIKYKKFLFRQEGKRYYNTPEVLK